MRAHITVSYMTLLKLMLVSYHTEAEKIDQDQDQARSQDFLRGGAPHALVMSHLGGLESCCR